MMQYHEDEITDERRVRPDIGEFLWGGPGQKGLAHVVTDLAVAVANLANTVTTLKTTVDSQGTQLVTLRTPIQIATRLLWIVAGVAVPGIIGLVARAIYISITGDLSGRLH